MAFKNSSERADEIPGRLPDIRSLSSYDRTKDISFHPYFLGGISRWVWRLWMYRVTQAGRWFIGLSLVLILYGTSSLDLQIYVPLMYAFGVLFFAWLAALFLPPKVKVECAYPDRVAVGVVAPATVTVTSLNKWPLDDINVIAMRLPPYVDFHPRIGVHIRELRPGETFEASISFWCRKRGVYRLRGFRVETSFPLGLLNSYSIHSKDEQLLVYPRFSPLNHINLPSGQRYQPGGVALASKLGESLEYIGNREYREGDNIRDIDWRATARLTRPIVREYREEYFHRAGVILDTFVPRNDRARENDFENAVSVCAAISDYMSREEYVVDLFAAGPMLYHLTAGRNLAFQDQILDILACLVSVTAEPFEVLESELLDTLSQLTTVVCVFLDWNATRHAFVDRIRQMTAVKVVIIRSAICTINPQVNSSELSLAIIDDDLYHKGVYEL